MGVNEKAVKIYMRNNPRGDSVQFVSTGKPMTAFDDMGDTSMSSIINRVTPFHDDMLTALWNEASRHE